MVGSAALNMCMVASGQADSYYEVGIHCWDIAAGDVIVREAGGVAMMPSGEALTTHSTLLSLFHSTGEGMDLMKRGILCASSTELAFQLVPIIGHLKHSD